MRYWLLTNTTYGTWLPGSARGSVTNVRDLRPGEEPTLTRHRHNQPGEAWEPPIPGLESAARSQLKGPPIWFETAHAHLLLDQWKETAEYRRWRLLAVAIMKNHFHLVVGVPDDPDPRKILADFKAYGTRVLNRRFGRPPSLTWWTHRGSKRKLPDRKAVVAAVNYVLFRQEYPLLTWAPEDDLC